MIQCSWSGAVIAASCSRAQYLINQGKDRKEVLALVGHFCGESRLRVRDYFRGIRHNHDSAGYKLAQSVLGDASPWLSEEIVGERLLDLGERRKMRQPRRQAGL